MPIALPIAMSASAAQTRKTNNSTHKNTVGPITYAVSSNENDFAATGSSIPSGVTPIDTGPFPGFELDSYV